MYSSWPIWVILLRIQYCNYFVQEKYKMMPFHGCYLSFHGFPEEEKKHMEESTERHGKNFNSIYSEMH